MQIYEHFSGRREYKPTVKSSQKPPPSSCSADYNSEMLRTSVRSLKLSTAGGRPAKKLSMKTPALQMVVALFGLADHAVHF